MTKKYPDDQRFQFVWLDGKVQDSYGRDVADAFRRLGYSAGAMRALDYACTVSSEESGVTGEGEV